MTIALDASMLILLFDADARAPTDPETGLPVAHCQERLNHFLNSYAKPKGSRIIIPAPALGEFLVHVAREAAGEYVSQIVRIRGCEIVSFGTRAAIEFADIQRMRLPRSVRRNTNQLEGRAKAKFDQQIVAIAKTHAASSIYTDDKGLAAYAKVVGIDAIGIAALPLSPDSAQGKLQLELPAQPQSPIQRGDGRSLDGESPTP